MIKLTIDDIEVEVEDGTTILQACETAGKEIPRFCYHEKLSIAGNCRMCLVEMERAPKPIASCAMPAGEGMVIKTDSPMVQKAREGVMEFMLINHPLDCPICDQGGECDLQDQAMGYGVAESRYLEPKRAVENKAMGPLISTIMTRCIHCTRCVRFATEVAGVPELGAIGRGEDMEITTYLEQALASELSGNVVDLCPVGALTSRPYAYQARSWELTHTPSIDVMDGLGSHIRVDSRGNQVMRVLPRRNDDINEEWISDKTRHAIDGLLAQRLDRPYLRGRDGRLAEASWDEAFTAIKKAIKKAKADEIGALVGDLADAEAIFALGQLLDRIGTPHRDCRQDGAVIGSATGTGGKAAGGYLFNSGINGVDVADAILLIGTNPRTEAPVLNARIRQNWLNSGVPVFRLGGAGDLTYPLVELGDDARALEGWLNHDEAGGGAVINALKSAKCPMVILGRGALNRPDSMGILHAVGRLAEQVDLVKSDWNGFNVLHSTAGVVGGLMLGFVPQKGGFATPEMVRALEQGRLKVLYNLGADEVDLSRRHSDSFIIYQGSHGDRGAGCADVVLPAAAWPEKDATYVNTEGRVQRANRATFPPGEAREDWAIIRALSAVLGKKLGFDDLGGLRQAMISAVPEFGEMDKPRSLKPKKLGRKQAISTAPLQTHIKNFYMTCPISRASVTMAECVKAFVHEDAGENAGENAG